MLLIKPARTVSSVGQTIHLNRIMSINNQWRFFQISSDVHAVALQQQQEQRLEEKEEILKIQKTSFNIPIPTNVLGMQTIPYVRQMLVEHAQNTYKGIGKMDFDSNVKRTMKEGSDTAILPLSTSDVLRLYYRTHDNRVRYGMLIEQLDMFATWIGYKHNQDPNVPMETPAHPTIGVVTSFVDTIDVHQEEAPVYDRDIFFHGYTSWVGKSSSEVVVHVQQKYNENDIRDIITAKFVMVTLNSEGKKAQNIRLALETEEDLQRYQEAERAKRLRQEIKQSSLLTNRPTVDELYLLHNLNQKATELNLFSSTPTFCASKSVVNEMDNSGQNFISSDECRYEKSLICFPFQRNLHRKIFGGYMMRKAHEAAYSHAALFSQCVPKFIFGGQITFHKAVDIGSILWMKSQVCYTKNEYMQIRITGEVYNGESNQFEICNSYQYTFKADKSLPEILPSSYTDGLHYLTAKRNFETFVIPRIQQ